MTQRSAAPEVGAITSELKWADLAFLEDQVQRQRKEIAALRAELAEQGRQLTALLERATAPDVKP